MHEMVVASGQRIARERAEALAILADQKPEESGQDD